MMPRPDEIPGVTDDPVIRLLLRGEARTLHEAEEKYLDAAIPEVLDLLRGPLSNDELARHPLSPEARLAEVLTALEAVGLNCLVMGGHAVRPARPAPGFLTWLGAGLAG